MGEGQGMTDKMTAALDGVLAALQRMEYFEQQQAQALKDEIESATQATADMERRRLETHRLQLAACAMQGLVAHFGKQLPADEIATASIWFADTLAAGLLPPAPPAAGTPSPEAPSDG
jgi:hypothetical protein